MNNLAYGCDENNNKNWKKNQNNSRQAIRMPGLFRNIDREQGE